MEVRRCLCSHSSLLRKNLIDLLELTDAFRRIYSPLCFAVKTKFKFNNLLSRYTIMYFDCEVQ